MANEIRKIIGNIGKNSAVMYAAVLGVICVAGSIGIRLLMLAKTASAAAAKKALPAV